MRRLLALPLAPPGDPVVNAKQQMIDALCAKVRDVNTFASIGAIVGFGRNFVSKRLLPKFKEDPGTMYKIGDDYRIPRATAERFIRELYG